MMSYINLWEAKVQNFVYSRRCNVRKRTIKRLLYYPFILNFHGSLGHDAFWSSAQISTENWMTFSTSIFLSLDKQNSRNTMNEPEYAIRQETKRTFQLKNLSSRINGRIIKKCKVKNLIMSQDRAFLTLLFFHNPLWMLIEELH